MHKQGLFLGKLEDQRQTKGNMKSSHESNLHGFLVGWVVSTHTSTFYRL